MNKDIFAGKWKEMRGQIRQWWGRLTDDDMNRINGKKDQLVGSLQKRYGYTKERAQQEINNRFNTSGD